MRALSKITEDVDRGFALVALLASGAKELKAVEARLKQDALDRPDEHEPLKDADREGRQFTAMGTKLNLPIVLTADKIVGSFAQASKVHKRIGSVLASIEGAKLETFYQSETTFKTTTEDGKAFRALAADRLGEDAARFITACIAVDKDGVPKSDIKCEWTQAAAEAAKKVEVPA